MPRSAGVRGREGVFADDPFVGVDGAIVICCFIERGIAERGAIFSGSTSEGMSEGDDDDDDENDLGGVWALSGSVSMSPM